MNKFIFLLKHPFHLFESLGHAGLLNWMNDKTYLSILYRIRMKKRIDWNNLETYSEKLQWIKLYDRNPLYTDLVDKYKVKEYVESIIGNEYIIPTYGIWNNANDIDYKSLPNQFVLKCTHDSGGIYICTNKSNINIKKINKKLNHCLKHNFYYGQREWPYKNVKPRIIAEKYMVDESNYELKDYKFFCFNGKPKYMFIAKDRNNQNEETKFDFFDMNFNHLNLINGHPNASEKYNKPNNFSKMVELASKLSKGIPQVRVDFYDINGKIYFGEMTFFHWSGLMPFEPEEWDKKFGELIDLSKIAKK